ncbi:MAG TPA: FliA/WhiG family RNA polymerase sigma factor [Desulfatiglandales bacterium]|nr:FliA/WhiG family RNA polymerase sigma factor [Desulfatiglandales bacterium]
MKAGISKYQQSYDIEQGKVDPKLREELIVKYAPLVKYIAGRMAIRVPPNISREELISAGIVGLLDALDKFDSGMGIKFQTYAEHRIRGAILDELRKMDWIPRSVRKDIHRVEDAITALNSRLNRDPDDLEVAQEIGVDIDTYYKMISRAQGVGLLSLDKVMEDGFAPAFTKQASGGPSPFDELKVKEVRNVISKILSDLSEKEQLVITLYYYEELTLKEIAAVLSLTESRISQIHSKSIIRLRAKLRSYNEG